MGGLPYVANYWRSLHQLAPMSVAPLAARTSTCACAQYGALHTAPASLACSSVAAMPRCYSGGHEIRWRSAVKSVPGSVELSLGRVSVRVGADEKHPSRVMFAVQPVAVSVVSSHQ